MAPSPLDKQTAGCDSPYNWLMRLAMDLAALCGMYRGQNGINGCHLAVFSLDVAFAHHFMAICLLPTIPPYRNASDIGYASKKLSKMVGNSASYLLNSWLTDGLQIAIELWQISCKHLFSFLSYNTSNN